MTHYFPIFLDLNHKPCLVIGGGNLAQSKTLSLISHGARVTLVSPDATEQIQTWAATGAVTWKQAVFHDDDLDGFFMVVAATGDEDLNQRVYQLGQARHMLVNAVDDPSRCNFILGAVATSGPVQVAVSSAGTSPLLAGRIRDRIRQEMLGPQTGALAAFLGEWRPRVKAKLNTYQQKLRFWRAVLDSEAPEQLAAGRALAAERTVGELLNTFAAETPEPNVTAAV